MAQRDLGYQAGRTGALGPSLKPEAPGRFAPCGTVQNFRQPH
jgi:hypothetical protein